MKGPERTRFPHTSKLRQDEGRKTSGMIVGDELQKLISRNNQEGNPELPIDLAIEVGMEYLTEHFTRQAASLKKLASLNSREEQRRAAAPLMIRRLGIQESLLRALDTEAFTGLERDHLLEYHDFCTGFLNHISQDMHLFHPLHGMSQQTAGNISGLVTSETVQHLAEIIILNGRQPTQEGARFEQKLIKLLNSMASAATNPKDGEVMARKLVNGAYGTAAAYLMFQNPRENHFNKSFRVMFPSPYLDAAEQTDLLLIDEEGIPPNVRSEIAEALLAPGSDPARINSLSPEAKKRVIKVQVKSRYEGSDELTADEAKDREHFISSRCTSKGFDKGEYVVLTYNRARALVDVARRGSAI